MNGDYLFVYGTLRRDLGGRAHGLLARSAEFAGDATFRGRLYLVDDYPGAVPSDDLADKVFGEVYRLLEPGTVLAGLDAYEGCGPGAPSPTEYVRRRGCLWLWTGREAEAWIYLYNRATAGLRRIGSGTFRRRGERCYF